MTPLEWPLWWTASSFVALEDDHVGGGVAARELARRGEADDAGSDDADVAAGGGRGVHATNGNRRLAARAGSIVSMGEQSRRSLRSRGASITLAVVGAILALLGGFLLYARQELFQPDNLAANAQTALSDQRTRLAIAQPIVDGIVDTGSGELVNARPFIESIVISALDTPPVKAAFSEAVKAIDTKLVDRTPNTLLLNLTDSAVVAAKALDALAPQLGKGVVPKQITDVKAAILGSEITITPLHFVHEIDLFGIVLPILAVLMLVASIVVAPERRRGVQRAGIAVAVAAMAGLVAQLVGRSLALGQIDDPLVRDAAAAVWDALLGDLLVWTIAIGMLALLLAAVARFGAAEIDPLAPLARAAELARATRPGPGSESFAASGSASSASS